MGMYGIPLKGFEKWETKILVYEGLRNSGTKIEMELEYKVHLTVRKYYGQDTEFERSMVLETSSYTLLEAGELAFIRKPYYKMTNGKRDVVHQIPRTKLGRRLRYD